MTRQTHLLLLLVSLAASYHPSIACLPQYAHPAPASSMAWPPAWLHSTRPLESDEEGESAPPTVSIRAPPPPRNQPTTTARQPASAPSLQVKKFLSVVPRTAKEQWTGQAEQTYLPPVSQATVPECQRETVTFLLRTMLRSVMPDDANPNPSVLIALRLARDHNLPREQQLLQGLKAAAVRKVHNGEDFSSGMVALYTLALTASCSDPSSVTFSGSSVNLREILAEKLNREIQHIETTTFPLSNYYQVSLDVLTLCLLKVEMSHRTIKTLTDAVLKNKFTHESEFSVDTGAVAALALRCLSDRGLLVKDDEEALNKVVSQILGKVSDDGTIGNLYSTGLAIQAISVNPHDVPVNAWSCSKSLKKLLSEIPTGSFSNPQAASQIAPSLEGRTYLDVGKLDCAADVNNLTLPEISTAPPPVTQAVLIRVEYNIEDGLQHTFSDAVNVTIARGSRLIRVLEEAQHMYPVRFRFNTTMSLWGPSLTSVRGLSASSKERTYWQLLNGSAPLGQGIGDYQPVDGESIFAVLSTY